MSAFHRQIDQRRWRHVRRRVLERDGYRCTCCGKAGRLEVDHIVGLERDGAAYDPGNLQTLCRGCHIAKTRRERRQKTITPAVTAWRSFVNELLPTT